MKIGVIADPPLVIHSCAVVAGQLAKQWVRLGHEVFYLGYAYKGEKYLHPDGYEVHPDTQPCTSEQSVTKFIEDTGVEILYAHGSKDIFRGGIAAAKKKGIPYVPHTFYSTPYKNDKVNTFEAKSGFILYDCEEVDDMFVCNNFSVGVGFALGKRTWFVPNGVDTELFFPCVEGENKYFEGRECMRKDLGIPSNALVFLFSGSNLSGKDPGRALDAFAKYYKKYGDTGANQRPVYLAMHTRPGDSEQEQKQGMTPLRKIAEELGVSDRVKFFTDAYPEWLEGETEDYQKTAMSPPYTKTPYALMGAVFRAGDIQLVPSLMEGMSTTILEGMACGLPIICSDDEVVSEPVVHYSTGLLVHRLATNENITEEVVERMFDLASDEALLKDMSKNAADLVRIKYSWGTLAKQFIYFFNTLLNKKYA